MKNSFWTIGKFILNGGEDMPSLTKDIEQLFIELQSTKPKPITDILEKVINKNGDLHKKYPSGWKIKSLTHTTLPMNIEQGGIYAFWWLNNSPESFKPFWGANCSRKYSLKGKKIIGMNNLDDYHQIEIEITDNWLNLYNGNIPLYVGKSAECILKRMALHLQINKEKYRGKTTADQLRRGIERLFPGEPNTAELIVNHVAYSFIPLHGPDEVVNRFYLEDYAIRKLQPLFNIDVER